MWMAGWLLLTLFVVLAIGLNGAILLFAAWQWVVLLPRPGSAGFGPLLWITAVTSTVSNGGPFLSGHAAGIYLLSTRGRLGYPAAVSMKLQEQLVGGIAKLLLFGLTLYLAPLPTGARSGALGLLGLVSLFGLGLLFAAHRGHQLGSLAAGRAGWYGKVLSFLDTTAGGLEALRRPAVLLLAVALGVGKKAVEGLAVWAVIAALGMTLPFWGVLAVLSAVNLSTMVSITPANVGIYEGSAVIALGLCGIGAELALGAAVVLHLAYLIPMAGVGWVVLLFLPEGNRAMLKGRSERLFHRKQL
jgi:uncharacterized membrane protein YbhN (UPF0104 family)